MSHKERKQILEIGAGAVALAALLFCLAAIFRVDAGGPASAGIFGGIFKDNDDQTGAEVFIDASGFAGNLTASETNAQLVADALDGLSTGGGGAWTHLASTSIAYSVPQFGSGNFDEMLRYSFSAGELTTNDWIVVRFEEDYVPDDLVDVILEFTDGTTTSRIEMVTLISTPAPRLHEVTMTTSTTNSNVPWLQVESVNGNNTDIDSVFLTGQNSLAAYPAGAWDLLVGAGYSATTSGETDNIKIQIWKVSP